MNATQSPAPTGEGSPVGKKVRKPYTITKSRESWTDDEHDKFLEALHLFDRDWKKIEDFVGSKTVIQMPQQTRAGGDIIRSHAQKYFLKIQKNGTVAHVPPPRPKRKAAHPYPQKAQQNALPQAAIGYSAPFNSEAPGYPAWDDDGVLVNTSQDDYNTSVTEGDNGIGSSSRSLQNSGLSKQGKGSVLHGLPDFAEVYSFIGGVFDPETKGHAQKLKEMDPINFETVLLLMRNLTLNLSTEFEPVDLTSSKGED